MKSILETTVEQAVERLAKFPNDLPTREKLAEAYAAMKKPALAAEQYLLAAEGWEKAGRAQMAASQYHKALTLLPDRKDLIEKIQKLAPPKKR